MRNRTRDPAGMEVIDDRIATETLIVGLELVGQRLQQRGQLARLTAAEVSREDRRGLSWVLSVAPHRRVEAVEGLQHVEGRHDVTEGQRERGEADDRLEIQERAHQGAAR